MVEDHDVAVAKAGDKREMARLVRVHSSEDAIWDLGV